MLEAHQSSSKFLRAGAGPDVVEVLTVPASQAALDARREHSSARNEGDMEMRALSSGSFRGS